MTGQTEHPRSRLMSAMVVVLCAFLTGVGVLATLVCVVLIRLELNGFGLPLDADPRVDYIAGLVIGAAAGILIPAVTCFFLLRSSQRLVAVFAALVALVVAILFFGMGL